MISSFIQGGLGNQLFQIAAGYAHAKRTGSEFALIEGQHHLPLQGNGISTYKDNILRNISFRPQQDFGRCLQYKEKGHKYVPLPLTDNLFLIGYFQSEKYFYDCTKDIATLFAPPAEIEKNVLDMYPFLLDEKTVSLHVRRGDYLNNPAIHPEVGKAYYRKALDSLTDKDKVLVFSDDIEWCKKEFSSDFIYSSLDEDYLDLYAMMKCHHHVMSNSTFSWWGAWLSRKYNRNYSNCEIYTEGVVIAPETWFGPNGPQDTEDIIPSRWERMGCY